MSALFELDHQRLVEAMEHHVFGGFRIQTLETKWFGCIKFYLTRLQLVATNTF